MSKVEEVVVRADQVDEVGVTEDIWWVRFIAKFLQMINAPLFKSTLLLCSGLITYSSCFFQVHGRPTNKIGFGPGIYPAPLK